MSGQSAARAIVWLLCAIVLAGCGAGHRGPFDYDGRAPLDVRASSSHIEFGVRVSELTYASPKGGRVPALLFVPPGKGPFAGLILQHGLPGGKEEWVEAPQLAKLGAVVLAIDAPFARRSGEPIAFTRRDRAEQIQLIVDLRRAVDLLRERADVDDARIGYWGFSYGAAMGGLLAGAERRITAFVLMSGDGGLISHFSDPEDRPALLMLSSARRAAWQAAMRPIEPLRWVKRASAPILFQFGRHDQLIPTRDQVAYGRAALQPKQIRWYDGDHFLTSEAWCDAAHFLGRHIGIAGAKEPECGY